MSIGIYAFLRIYFFGFGLSDFARFRTRCPPSSAPHPVRSSQRGLSGIECRPVQRVQHPGVCVGAWRGLPCIWHGLRCCLSCAVRPGALGLGSPPAGYTAAALPRPVSPVTTEKIKKTHPTLTKRNLSDCASLQKFRKKQKDPLRSH